VVTQSDQSNQSPGARLRRLMQRDRPVVAPGAHDPFTARMIEDAGFPAVYMGGLTSAVHLGISDVTKTQTETLECARRILDVVDIPLIADIESGFGEAVHVERTIRSFERAGVAAVHLEDEDGIKRAHYHYGEVNLLNASAAVTRLKVALNARRGDDFVVIARTDIYRDQRSMSQVVDRLGLFKDAGADVLMATGLKTKNEARQLADAFPDIPLVWVAGLEGQPEVSVGDLAELDYGLAIYAYVTQWAIVSAVDRVLATLRTEGVAGYDEADKPALRGRIHSIIGTDRMMAMEGTKEDGRER
jgi:2,3-dimethylmalate lyase